MSKTIKDILNANVNKVDLEKVLPLIKDDSLTSKSGIIIHKDIKIPSVNEVVWFETVYKRK